MIGGSENFAMKWTILVESSKRGRATRIFVGTFHVSCHLNIYLSFPFPEIFLLILLSREKVSLRGAARNLRRQTFRRYYPPAKFRISSRQNQAQTDRLAFNYVEAVPHLPCQLQPLIVKRNRKKISIDSSIFAKKERFILISERAWTRSMEEVGWRSARDREKPFVLCCTRCLDIYICI